MSDVLLTRQLLAAGIEPGDLRNRTRSGSLLHLRRGAYADPLDRTVYERHLLLTEAAVSLADSESVVSFGSAGVLHDLPIRPAEIDLVHLTRKRNSGGRIKPGIHVHVAPLEGSEVDEVLGMPVTSLDRTVVDLARSSPFAHAVAAGDVAARQGMDLAAVAEQLDRAKRRRGASKARRVARIIDSRSESVGESVSRVRIIEQGLPLPELQVEFNGPDGFLAVVDFLWPEYDLIGEFDGKVKYGRLLRPGEDPGDAVFREKQREDRLRDMGFIVVRWIWGDLMHPERLAARIRRAIDMAREL
jgi:hypothetical protein